MHFYVERNLKGSFPRQKSPLAVNLSASSGSAIGGKNIQEMMKSTGFQLFVLLLATEKGVKSSFLLAKVQFRGQ